MRREAFQNNLKKGNYRPKAKSRLPRSEIGDKTKTKGSITPLTLTPDREGLRSSERELQIHKTQVSKVTVKSGLPLPRSPRSPITKAMRPPFLSPETPHSPSERH